jgi:hypothetical protein
MQIEYLKNRAVKGISGCQLEKTEGQRKNCRVNSLHSSAVTGVLLGRSDQAVRDGKGIQQERERSEMHEQI